MIHNNIRKSLKLIIGTFLAFLVFIFSRCSQNHSEQELVKMACSSCHMQPLPSQLDKKSWQNNVLPRMGAWLGIENTEIILTDLGINGLYGSLKDEGIFIPKKPIISPEEWQQIKNYFISNAPDSLPAMVDEVYKNDLDTTFENQKFYLKNGSQFAYNTLVKISKQSGNIHIGTGDGLISTYNNSMQKVDSILFKGAPTDLIENNDKSMDVLIMGGMIPNNYANGKLVHVGRDKTQTILIPKLRRPVFIKKGHFKKEEESEFLIGNFGLYLGSLSLYSKSDDGTYKENVLLQRPGAIQAYIDDINNDGLDDIIVLMSQSNEAIYLFENKGNAEFKQSILLQFPPMYGSSDFLWEDLDGDGKKEIVVAHGDNGDFSMIRKPYHGVGIYHNDGNNKFSLTSFKHIHGATRLESGDFNNDGKTDICVLSYFAKFEDSPQKSLAVLQNEGNLTFEVRVSSAFDLSRWLVMDAGDVDHDGTTDIVVGGHVINMLADPKSLQSWQKDGVDFMYLKNKGTVNK